MKKLSSPKNDSIDVSLFPVYVVNLKKRPERKEHVIEQFKNKDEFHLTIVEAFEHSVGALGLWMTLRYIFMDLVGDDREFVIIAEDDVEFTAEYSKEYLLDSINEAKEKGADVLLGGLSWFSDAIQLSSRLFWVQSFNGLQFTVVFRNFFPVFSQRNLNNYTAADFHISSLTKCMFFMYPFVAIQKEFGYSDATPKNNEDGRVKALFEASIVRLKWLNFVKDTYQSIPDEDREDFCMASYNDVMIPTYVINLPERTERLEHIRKQFVGKPEFDVTIVEACEHEVGALGLWLSIRKIINMALINDDDAIIICEDDHEFTKDYSKAYLLENILAAYEEGACYLSGGTAKFQNAMPITANRFWVGHCLSTQFTVIFKRFFKQILDEPYDEKIVADLVYSRLALNKMVLYPFISTQKDFGYSDITSAHNENKNLVTTMFLESSDKLKTIQRAYLKYQPENISI